MFSGKNRDKDPLSKKSQFYVEFLGWMECRGLRGARYTDSAVKELRRKHRKMDKPPKLTIQVGKKELKISQDVEEKKRRNIKKIKFPTIPARDITYANQTVHSDGRPDDVVACIYLGYMPRTRRYVHVHVYRFDSPSTAATFVRLMNRLTETNSDRIREIEQDLIEKGEVDDPRLGSSDGMSEPHTSTDSAAGSVGSNYSEDGSPTFGSDEIDPDLQSLTDVQPFDSVTEELKHRLKFQEGPPILLPPKDYDTISRQKGNLIDLEWRRCLQLNIVGNNPGTPRARYGSGESGVEIPSPSTESEGKLPETISENSSPNTPPPMREFVYPPAAKSPIGPPPLQRGDSFTASNPRSPVIHGRQASQSSAYSSHSFRSEDSRSSQFSDSGDEVVIYRGGMMKVGEDPPADYDPNLDVVMRRPQYHKRVDLVKSMPTDMLQRELSQTTLDRDDYYKMRRSHMQDNRMISTMPADDYRVRRVNSMYR